MTISYTSHFRLPIPDFLQEPWHEELEASIRAMDTAIYQTLISSGADNWLNSHAYVIGNVVISPDDGTLWTCAIAHTSPATPVTFTTFVGANPTYWNRSVTIPQFRGAWQTGTSYTANDFVVDTNRYAVCIVSHVSGTFDTDLAAGKWVVLIDLSTIGLGINSSAETSIASAATCNIGAEASTRLLITGVNTISSFGTVANTFKIVRYVGSLSILTNANIILTGGINRLTRSGDIQWLVSDSTGAWHELFYTRFDGGAADEGELGLVKLASIAETVVGVNTVHAVTPAGTKAAVLALIPSGTRMLFQQTAAPTGWTKITTHDDKALRIVSGSVVNGGSIAFSTLFGRTAVDGHTITQSELPNVNFTVSGITLADAGHRHFVANIDSTVNTALDATNSIEIGRNVGNDQSYTLQGTATEPTLGRSSSSTSGISVSAQGQAASGGGGSSHVHTIDMRVQYVDVIIATKD